MSELDGQHAPGSISEVLACAPLAWLIVAIDSRMSHELRLRVAAEDLAQEVLMAFWQARGRYDWRGPKALRSYLLTLADRVIAGAADHHFAAKRGGIPRHSAGGAGIERSSFIGAGTTPSGAARRDERAAIMREALAALPDEVRECVRLRLFEEKPIKAISAALSIPETTVRRRLRIGSEMYMTRLRDALASRTATLARTDESITQDSLAAAIPGLNSHP